MRSPRDMRIIEIDITNACDKQCSNCTRLCGHHAKPYFMDYDTFKKAVDSLDGYQGIRSIMGGEPTLHPEFERFVEYMGSKFPRRDNPFVYPQKEFIKQVHRVELDNFQMIHDGDKKRMDVVGPGMFSNMGATFRKHYEVITDNMPFMGLNDHMNPCYHQSALITRKELGIPDDEWIKMRDNCWLQNEWSAGITPKGAFFCEIAAVLDWTLGGPGGWKIEPGWWKRKPEAFGDQLHWCELCGFALKTFTRDSAEEIDDVSPEWYERLKKLNSPKMRSGRVNVIKIENGKISEESKKENKFFSKEMPYLEHYEDRFNALNSVLFTHEYEETVLEAGNNYGAELNRIIINAKDWIVVRSANAQLTENFQKQISSYVLNPGTLHLLDLSKSDDNKFVSNAKEERHGYVALFSKNALSLRKFGFDGIAHISSIFELADAWQPAKIVELSSKIDEAAKRMGVVKEAKYVIWGVGDAGGSAAELIQHNGGNIVAAVDIDVKKQGEDFCGFTVLAPGELVSMEFDLLIAANYTHFIEIKEQAKAFGIPEEKIQYINDITA